MSRILELGAVRDRRRGARGFCSRPAPPRLGALRGEAEVIAVELPGGLGRVDLAEKAHVSQHGRLVLGQEGAGPVGAVVDPGDASGLCNFIAAVSLDPVVRDFSALPLDLVSQVVELIAAVEPEQRVVVVGGAQDRVFGEDRREWKLGLSGVLSRWTRPPLMRAVT